MGRVCKKVLSFLTAISIIFSIATVAVFATGDYNVSTMHPGVDNNSFDNDVDAFVTEYEKSKYYSTAIEINKLKEGESEDIQNLITSQVLSAFQGSSYGISSAMALFYVGKINTAMPNFYSINLLEHLDLRCRINFYQLSQFCENKYPSSTPVVKDGVVYSNALKQIVEFSKVGDPFIITFRTNKFAHSVVACGYEHLDNGSHKICVIDSNQKDSFMYLNISSNYSSWSFENSLYDTNDIIDLSFSTLEAFNPLAPEEESKVVYSTVPASTEFDILCTSFYSDFTIKNSDGKSLTIKDGKANGDMDYELVKYISNSTDEKNTKVVLKIENSDYYTVANNNFDKLDVTVVGDNGLFFTAQGVNIKTVRAEKGKVTVDGENMEYSVTVFSTEENVEMANITGADPSSVTVEAKDGVTVSNAENGKARVAIMSNGQIYEKDFTIEQGSFNVLYSMIVKTNIVDGPGDPILKAVIILLVGLVFIGTLAFTYKKYSKKNPSTKKKEAKNG